MCARVVLQEVSARGTLEKLQRPLLLLLLKRQARGLLESRERERESELFERRACFCKDFFFSSFLCRLARDAVYKREKFGFMRDCCFLESASDEAF